MILPSLSEKWEYGIGLMSGTSMDGVDIALCAFRNVNNKWEYKIEDANTFVYPAELLQLLQGFSQLSAEELIIADRKLGLFYGKLCSKFISKQKIQPSFIASHGHTIFHNPSQGYTFQAGHASSIVSETNLLVVSDFRSLDIAYGGQGAPLVPIGDALLFSDYDVLINLGGFSNISFDQKGKRLAYDICPLNMALNYYAQKTGKLFDKDGEMAASGTLNLSLIETLNSMPYYSKPYPKSLGREWFEDSFLGLMKDFENLRLKDILRSITEHICIQIYAAADHGNRVLFTGGGIRNTFLAEILKIKFKERMCVPSGQIIDFKEALIFAFMGLLRIKGVKNTIASATGATQSLSAGLVSLP